MRSLFVVVGPSGSGKDTLLGRLLSTYPRLAKPVTTTTRAPHDYEVDGQHYNFLTRHAFEFDIETDALVEYAVVHGNYYGLSKEALSRVRDARKVPAAILDVQGLETVRKLYDVRSVFITAPVEQLLARMPAGRPPEELEARRASIARELEYAATCDLVINNADGQLEISYDELCLFVESHVLR